LAMPKMTHSLADRLTQNPPQPLGQGKWLWARNRNKLVHNDCMLFTIGNLAPFQGGSPRDVFPGVKTPGSVLLSLRDKSSAAILIKGFAVPSHNNWVEVPFSSGEIERFP
jgi:hypothetical protein